MKILHISPSYFGPESIIGGGERYVQELTQAMAEQHEVRLVSFGRIRETRQLGSVRFEIYPVSDQQREFRNNPISLNFLREIVWADVIQTHQVHTWSSDVAALAGRILGRKCFTLDHGGGGGRVLSGWLPVFSCYRRAMALSAFGVKQLPSALQSKSVVVRGGIDTQFFSPSPGLRPKRVLYAGRLLPHKGVHVLLEAVRLLADPQVEVHLVGREGDESYAAALKDKAQGLNVVWRSGISDEELRQEYQQARVSVLLSSHRGYFGHFVAVPELMGLVLAEAQSCGTPVVCTRVGGMPEFVQHEQTGWIVPPDDPAALAEVLGRALNAVPTDQEAWSQRVRASALALDWRSVAEHFLKIYATA